MRILENTEEAAFLEGRLLDGNSPHFAVHALSSGILVAGGQQLPWVQ
jgi:hypothetical protein